MLADCKLQTLICTYNPLIENHNLNLIYGPVATLAECIYLLFHRNGTMMWFNHPKHRHYTGNWRGGFIEGHGAMIFADQSTYTGWWHMGMRHQHGRMESRQDSTTYTGGWEKDRRCGYGVLDSKIK